MAFLAMIYEKFAQWSFEANTDDTYNEAKAKVKLNLFVSTKKWNLVIESNNYIESNWVKIYEIYEDILKVNDL